MILYSQILTKDSAVNHRKGSPSSSAHVSRLDSLYQSPYFYALVYPLFVLLYPFMPCCVHVSFMPCCVPLCLVVSLYVLLHPFFLVYSFCSAIFLFVQSYPFMSHCIPLSCCISLCFVLSRYVLVYPSIKSCCIPLSPAISPNQTTMR